MMKLPSIISYLDLLLKTDSIHDYPQALNGLQLENNGFIERIAMAVDASAAVIQKAVEEKNTLLLVHHGLFWSGLRPLRDSFYRKIKLAIDAQLAIYSSHLPLDLHPLFGNNILLAQELDLFNLQPAFEIEGQFVGYIGECIPMARNEFLKKITILLGKAPNLAPGGPEIIEKVLVVSGGAGNRVAEAFAYGIDTFVTGEGSHWSYQEAEELGINLIYAGHYATETFGVKALGKHLSEYFELPCSFIDHPSGL